MTYVMNRIVCTKKATVLVNIIEQWLMIISCVVYIACCIIKTKIKLVINLTAKKTSFLCKAEQSLVVKTLPP